MNKLSFNPLKAMLAGLLLIAATLTVNGQFTFQKKYHRPSQSFSGTWHDFTIAQTRAIAQNQYSPNDYFIAGGYISSPRNNFPDHCGVIYKLNLRGELQWAKEFLRHGYFNDIKCTYSNNALSGLIVGGGSFPNTTNFYEFLLVKTDANGSPLYRKTYAPNSTCEKVEQVITNGTNDGFIAVGKQVTDNPLNSLLLVVRVKEDLTLYWQNTYDLGNTSIDEAYSVKQTSDGGFIVTGRASDALIVLKLNSTGTIAWQWKYEYNNETLIGNDIIEVQNSSSQPEYYVLGNTSGTTDDNLLILKLDQNGVHQLTALVQITGTHEKAKGIIELPSGEFVISGTSDDKPILLRVLWGVAATFQKKYTNSLSNSTVVATKDNGFIIGGYNNVNSNGSPNDGYFYVIKTDANGVSDCSETDITASYSAVPITSTTLNYSVTSLNNIYTDYGGYSISLNEEVICKDFCKDVIKQTPNSSAHACFGNAITLNVSCPQGTISTEWYNSANMNTVISTTSSFVISDAIADATYIVRCINENGCVLKEETITFAVSPAPYSSSETIYACYGEHLSLTSPCGIGETTEWTYSNITTIAPTLNVDAMGNETYIATCIDQYGCITRTHAVNVEINFVPVVQFNMVTICEGASYDLNQSVSGTGTCVWSTSPSYTPVIGPVVSPTTTTLYHAECRDANGCYSYHAVEVTVTPAPSISQDEEICEGDVLVLNNYFNSNCTWIDLNTGEPVASTGITPEEGTHSYEAVCVDANGCITIFTLNVTVHQLNTITQTIYVNCGEVFDFEPYSTYCNGITGWAVKAGDDYVMLPFGWAPTANTVLYGFGTMTEEGCCLLVLNIEINEVTPTIHELCVGDDPYEIPFNCAAGSMKEWTFNGAPVPDGMVSGPGTYEVVCKDANGCIIRRAIYNITYNPECNQQILCLEEVSEFNPPCPPETANVICEKNGMPYPIAGGTVNPNGVGTYVIKCLAADGTVLATYYFLVHNCDENEADFIMSTNKVNAEISNIKLYPNPSNTGKFFLSINAKTTDVCAVRVFDGQGKELLPFKQVVPQTEELIDLSGRPTGIYHVQLLINNVPYYKIIVVE